MSFEVLSKIAASVKSEYLKGIRLSGTEGGTMMATDLMHTIKMTGIPMAPDVDCFVNQKKLHDAYTTLPQPHILQKPAKITVKDGRLTANISLMENKFPFAVTKKPEGIGYAVEDLVSALAGVIEYLRFDGDQAYVLRGHVYATDGDILVRHGTSFEEPKETRLLTFSKSFIRYLAAIKQEPIELLVDDNTLTMVYEDRWIEAARYPAKLPVDFVKYFEAGLPDDTEWIQLPPDVLDFLSSMCTKAAADSSSITMSEQGIYTIQEDQRSSWIIDYAMPERRFNSNKLNQILKVSDHFYFEHEKRVAFKGKSLEGFLSTLEVG